MKGVYVVVYAAIHHRSVGGTSFYDLLWSSQSQRVVLLCIKVRYTYSQTLRLVSRFNHTCSSTSQHQIKEVTVRVVAIYLIVTGEYCIGKMKRIKKKVDDQSV